MNADPIAALHDAPLETAAALLVQHRYRHLPTVDAEGRLVGLADDARVFARGE
jgi:CBS domain-containing protein